MKGRHYEGRILVGMEDGSTRSCIFFSALASTHNTGLADILQKEEDCVDIILCVDIRQVFATRSTQGHYERHAKIS